MGETSGEELREALLWARASVPPVRAALRPLEALERQLREYAGEAESLLAAYRTGAGIVARHPGAAKPFEPEAAASGLSGAARERVAALLLGAELRRGLLTYRLVGLTPRAAEAQLAQALKQRAPVATREALAAWQQRRGRRLPESDAYLAAWDEGLRLVGADPALAGQLPRSSDDAFVQLVLEWGRRVAERPH